MHAIKVGLRNILAVISIVLFTVLVITTSWQVISRQVFHAPSTWSEEFAKICFVWLTFLGSAFLFGERGHIAVDFLARKLPSAGQRAMQLFVQLMILFFAVVGMLWGGFLAAGNAWYQNLTALPFAIGWVYVVIPIAGVCIAIFAVIDLIEVATGKQEPYPEIEDPEAVRGQEDVEEYEKSVTGGEK
ncbi:TRAP transporter small permease [Corynebacterium cystitidis]|uniref:TRAP-type C4-dicarboxylate transport system, small permease component n=1 Tax=Corynebacterium cystitidis DSM 20524 TaxID=1121357 RepID=A0A1H9P0Y6_9CORY|nr:TRAP transporter small permease [Corynebacterium cystitidis]WJY82663.1 Sialic acid TRAP transporter permease protein SiaT [Corynebacterium cystitidis DSM 20524]SER41575.1 TRAP-type C4-dicarboxylate transport system, small permease component [Corynebacterium cystitidis DSM 20524]SNV72113.1 putative secondary C4-dicarboxylate transporter permease, tripartite ATP-independent transporter(TRAP-T) family [Corynebacterium cystitidis]